MTSGTTTNPIDWHVAIAPHNKQSWTLVPHGIQLIYSTSDNQTMSNTLFGVEAHLLLAFLTGAVFVALLLVITNQVEAKYEVLGRPPHLGQWLSWGLASALTLPVLWVGAFVLPRQQGAGWLSWASPMTVLMILLVAVVDFWPVLRRLAALHVAPHKVLRFAFRLAEEGHLRSAALEARMALELEVNKRCDERGLPQGKLYTRIDALAAADGIEASMKEDLHEMRKLGNRAAHEVANDEPGVSSNWANVHRNLRAVQAFLRTA